MAAPNQVLAAKVSCSNHLRGGMASRQMSSDVSGEEKSEEEKAALKVSV